MGGCSRTATNVNIYAASLTIIDFPVKSPSFSGEMEQAIKQQMMISRASLTTDVDPVSHRTLRFSLLLPKRYFYVSIKNGMITVLTQNSFGTGSRRHACQQSAIFSETLEIKGVILEEKDHRPLMLLHLCYNGLLVRTAIKSH